MHPALIVVIVLALVAALPVGLIIYFASKTKPPRTTFQALVVVQTMPTGLKTPDAFVRSFVTDTKAVTAGQVGPKLDVSIVDLATKKVTRQQVGDAAAWDGAILVGKFVVAISKPEGGKRKLFGISTLDGHFWSASVGGDGALLPGDVAPQLDNAPTLLWLDRQSGRMSHLSSVTGKPFGGTDGLPPNWQLLYSGTGPAIPVLVLSGGAVYDIGGDKPTKLPTAPITSTTVVGRLHIGDVVLGDRTGYQISVYSSGGRTSGFAGPVSRTLVWVGGCQQVSLVCVVDQAGTDESTREFAVYSTGGYKYWRRPVPYADTSRAPEFLGATEEGDAIVSTRKANVDGAVVFSASGTEIARYDGRVVGIAKDRAIQVLGEGGTGPVQVTLNGLDLNRNLSTPLGTENIRRAGCSWNATLLLCPGDADFTLWRMTK
jgi:hypothetical protein